MESVVIQIKQITTTEPAIDTPEQHSDIVPLTHETLGLIGGGSSVVLL